MSVFQKGSSLQLRVPVQPLCCKIAALGSVLCAIFRSLQLNVPEQSLRCKSTESGSVQGPKR